MIFDGHAHLFHPKVISNVKKRTALVDRLGLQTNGAEDRVGRSFLENELRENGIRGCFILPTAGVQEVGRVNESFYRMVKPSDLLYTAGTLHPGYSDNEKELVTFMKRNIKGIKMCSFSQKFALDDPKTFEMFDLIRHFNITQHSDFFVILDTLYGADTFFGSHPEHNTTPDRLANLVRLFPEINFIGAHMGGLAAPFKDVSTHLAPMENLFLDTSNAAHVLDENQFLSLLKSHGPEHIIFGTDWPWFPHAPEIDLQNQLFKKAGYSPKDAARVFSENIRRLLGLTL